MRTIVLLSALFVILVGCSSAGLTTIPDEQFGDQEKSDGIRDYSPIISYSEDSVTSYQGVFGVWKVLINTETLTAEIVPARNARAIGDVFDADLSQFLTVSPCSNCLQVGDIWLSDRYYDVCINIRLKHPFANIGTRPDLHGFDVRAILIGDGNAIMGGSYPDIKVTCPDGTEEDALLPVYYLRNADGYTSHFDELSADEKYFIGGSDVPGNLNPFLRFYEDYNTPAFDPHNPVGNNVMKVGAPYDERTAVFQLMPGDSILGFYLVADVAYGQSAVLANRPDPNYFLPAFHRTEPIRMEYWIENNNLSETNPTTTAELVVQVLDWQQGATVDPNYPDPANPSGIPESSNVASLELSIPSMMTSMLTNNTPESGSGTPADPLQYRFVIQNELLYIGIAKGLIAARDELHGSAAPSGRIPIPASPAGFPYETLDIRDYTLYDLVYINIPSAIPTRFNNELQFYDSNPFYSYGSISLTPVFFMDPGRTKFRYQWDFDYDGVTFDIDGTGLPSPNYTFPGPGIYTVGLKVRTNSVPQREYIYSIPVLVGGLYFNTRAGATTSNYDVTSEVGSPAIAVTNDKVYLAYSSFEASEDDIWLTIADFTGTILKQNNITSSYAGICQNPAIVAVETGSNPGIYVAFERHNGTNWDLHSTYGSLDGTNFVNSHIKSIDAGIAQSCDNVDLYHSNGVLYAYYEAYNPSTADDIWVAYSPDMGQTWNIHGRVNDNLNGSQSRPSAEIIPNAFRMMVTWQDSSDLGNRGWDIRIAESQSNLRDFYPSRNLSLTLDKTNETNPDLAAYENQYVIAYLSTPDGSTNSDVRIGFYYYYQPIALDYEVQFRGYNVPEGPPSISFIDPDSLLFSFMSYDAAGPTLKLFVNKLETYGALRLYREDNIYQSEIGTINFMRKPCIRRKGLVTSTSGGSQTVGVASFVAWTTYEEGYSTRVDPETLYLGDVDMLGYISQYKYLY